MQDVFLVLKLIFWIVLAIICFYAIVQIGVLIVHLILVMLGLAL